MNTRELNNEVLVTVFIRPHEDASSFGRCVESVQLQDVSPLEIIILDDGRSDGLREAVAPYLADGRINCVRVPKNPTPQHFQTHALEPGCGRYHTWLRGDEHLLPGHLARIIAGLEAHPECSLGYAAPEYAGTQEDTKQPPPHPGLAAQDYAGGRNDLGLLLTHGNHIDPAATVYRGSDLLRLGEFQPSARGAEAWELVTRLAIENPNFFYSRTPGVRRRLDAGSDPQQCLADSGLLETHLRLVARAAYSAAAERLRGLELEILAHLDRRIESCGAAAWTLDRDIRRVRGILSRGLRAHNAVAVHHQPAVSIVIPCYLQAQYVTEALESVVAQRFTDWECVVVDDGSPDDCVQVVRRFAATRGDGRIRLISQANAGLASARNSGINASQGRYILPLDADDKLHPDYLTQTVTVLDRYADIAIVYVDEQNFGLADHVHVKGRVSLEALKRHNIHDYCSLYRREVWERTGGYSPAMYLGGEDWEFWLAAAACGFKSHHVSQPLFLYRNRDNSMVADTLENLDYVRAQLAPHQSGVFDPHEISDAEERLKHVSPAQHAKLTRTRDTHPHNTLLLRFLDLAETDNARSAPELPPIDATPLVSVIIPTLDRPDLLRDAVASVLAQSYNNWEAIVVNDGGEDIGDWITAKDPHGRIRYVRHAQNRGLSAARNTGISLSAGAILCYLDDDDRLCPDHFETIVDGMRGNQAGLVYTEAEYVRERLAGGKRQVLSRTTPYSHIQYSLEQLHVGNFIPVNTWAHRRELIACTGDFDVTLNALEDWDLLLRLARITAPVHVPRITAEVRLRPEARDDNMSQRERHDFPALHRKIYARYPLPGNAQVELRRTQALTQLEGARRDEGSAHSDADRYARWQQPHALTENKAQYMAERMMLAWRLRPSFQLIAIHQGNQHDALADTLDSLCRQLYPGWGLSVIADCPAPDAGFHRLPNLEWVEIRGDLVDTLNRIVSESQADWIIRAKSGVQFAPHALLRWGDYMNRYPQWRIIYCDDDHIARDGTRDQPRFKPDFNLDLLRSTPYMGDVLALERDVLTRCGGFGAGAGVFDAVLRILDTAGESAVGHIPEVLVHYPRDKDREPIGAADAENDRIAVETHLERNGLTAQVTHHEIAGTFFVDYQAHDPPSVSILIPVERRYKWLPLCIEGLLQKTRYPDFEVVLSDCGGGDSDLLDELARTYDDKVRVLRTPGAVGSASLTHVAAAESRGELLLVLEPDAQAIHDEWLTRMVANVQRPEVGVVGARLIDLHGRVQHAGLILGIDDGAGRAFTGHAMQSPGYLNRLQVAQNFSAVSGACMLLSRELFAQLGGFDETGFTQCGHDVDLCLRARQAGYEVVWTPFATLLKHESHEPQSPAPPDPNSKTTADNTTLIARWPDLLANDPAYNRNLSLARGDMRVEDELAVPWTPPEHPRPRVWAFPLNRQGSGEYRVRQPLQALDRAAHAEIAFLPDHEGAVPTRVPTLCELKRAAPDTVLIHHGFTDPFLHWLPRYRKSGEALLVFGLDDHLLAMPDDNDRRGLMPADLEQRLRDALAHCHRLVVPTEPLAAAYRGFIDDVRVVPNLLERQRWGHLEIRRRRAARPRVGWVGAQQHDGDLTILAPVMEALAGEVDWVMMGMCPRALRPYVAEYYQPVVYRHYPAQLAQLDLDLAVAPLEINAFNECKSDLRVLEYGAMGWPVIATDIPPYAAQPITRVANDTEAWLAAIRDRIHDRDALAKDGERLRAWVHTHHMLEDRLGCWYAALLSDAVIERFALREEPPAVRADAVASS